MKRPLLTISAVACLALSAGGCYPDRLDSADYDAVATIFDSTGNFTAVTFALSDSVIHLVPPGSNDQISRALDATIIATARANMVAAGYTEVADPAVADLGLRVAVSSSDYTVIYWNDWCGYYGYWYPYGCYYPPYMGSVSYTVGTLFLSLTDHRIPAGTDVPMIWLAIGSGVAGVGSTSVRVVDAIDQMFLQSPYVDATP